MHTVHWVTAQKQGVGRTDTDVTSHRTSKKRQSEALGGSDECQSRREPVHLHRGSRLSRTHDDAHQTVIVRGAPGSPLGEGHSAIKPSGQEEKKKRADKWEQRVEVEEFGKLAEVEKWTLAAFSGWQSQSLQSDLGLGFLFNWKVLQNFLTSRRIETPEVGHIFLHNRMNSTHHTIELNHHLFFPSLHVLV